MAKLARLMSPDLPQYIEPARLADNAESLKGTLGIDNMQRLLTIVDNRDALITFHLSFSRNEEEDVVVIDGGFSTELAVHCQRCLEPMVIRLEKVIRIAWGADMTDVGSLAADTEPLEVSENRIALTDLIEDEVLLGLPMSPAHSPEECPATELLQELQVSRENPFAVLKNLKTDKQ
ncbi:MAG: YceD family protein [Gammaproteobacteria bacterium]